MSELDEDVGAFSEQRAQCDALLTSEPTPVGNREHIDRDHDMTRRPPPGGQLSGDAVEERREHEDDGSRRHDRRPPVPGHLRALSGRRDHVPHACEVARAATRGKTAAAGRQRVVRDPITDTDRRCGDGEGSLTREIQRGDS